MNSKINRYLRKHVSNYRFENFISLKFFVYFLSLIIFIHCSPPESKELHLSGKHFIRPLNGSEGTTVSDCQLGFQKVEIPTGSMKGLKTSTINRYQYCMEFYLPESYLDISDPALNLGFIDSTPTLYLNGKLIYSQTPENPMNDYLHDRELILPIPPYVLREYNVLIIEFSPHYISGNNVGIFNGSPRFSSYKLLHWRNILYKTYNFSKIVLFFSTSLLFFILWISRSKERKLLYFGFFVLISSIYYFTRLELKFDLHISLYLLKRLEFITLPLFLPFFSGFIYHILDKPKNYFKLLLSHYVIGILFLILFLIVSNPIQLSKLNFQLHLPILFFAILSIILYLIFMTFKKNKKAYLVLYLVSLPLTLSLFQLLNTYFLIYPEVGNIMVSSDSILILILVMTIYIARDFYLLQIQLDNTISKEETLRRKFQLYVPPREIENILNSVDENLQMISKGENVTKTILFSDIRDFTRLSEKMSPNEVVEFLNSYFARFISIIVESGGVVDKLIGDCIMARFDEGKEIDAILSALKMQEAILGLTLELQGEKINIFHGIGLARGRVVVGNIGSINKLDYTVIGDCVNLASRLESLTKYYNVPVLISESLYQEIYSSFLFREIDTIRVKGKEEVTKIYQPMGIPENDFMI